MEYVRTLSRELEVGERAELVIENRSGAIGVRGAATDKVQIEVVAHLWADDEREAEDQLELIARGIRADGARVAVRAPALLRPRPFLFFSRTPRVDYQLVVPERSRANVTSRSGRVEVEGIAGPLEVAVRSGRVAVRGIGADVRIESWSGSVHAEAIAGSLAIDSRSGSVRISRCRGDCSVSSRSGSLQVEDLGGSLEAQSRSGSVGILEVGGSLKLAARSGSVRYDGAVGGNFDIDVTSGSVRLAVDPESAFFLDAESAHGPVRSELPLRRKSGGPPKDAPTVRVRTRSGTILIVPR